MAGKNGHVIVQAKYLAPDPLKKERPIPARKVPPPDASLKEDVAPDQDAVVREIKTDAARAVTRNVEDPHDRTPDLAGPALVEQAVGLERLDVNLKAVTPEKAGVSDHRRGLRMIGNFAAMAALDFGRIGHVVKMPVRQEEPVNLIPGKPLVSTLRSVEKQVSPGGFEEKCVGVERAPGKRFEPICLHVV